MSPPNTKDRLTWQIECSNNTVWVSIEWEVPWWRRWFFGTPDHFVFGMSFSQMNRFVATVIKVCEAYYESGRH